MNLKASSVAAGIVNETQFSKTVHEKAYPGTSSANHFCQSLLADFSDYGFRHAFFAKMSEHKKDARQPFFTGIEQLVNQIRFVADVTCQQICYEHVGKGVLPVKRLHHCLLVDTQKLAFRHEIGRASCRERV